MSYLIYLLIICVLLFFVRKFLSRFKFPKVSCMCVVTGDLGAGKSAVSFAIAKSKFKSIHRSWAIRSFFRKLFHLAIDEEPLFYTNIPVCDIPYHELTMDHILKKVRFNFGSVVWVDEASLLADCYLSFDDKTTNSVLLSFWKLFRHETHSGYCIINSQSLTDLHISIRKCCSQYFYLHDTCSSFFVPFVAWCHMREERHSVDNSTINNYANDVEETLKTCLFSKKVFKMYDTHCFSSLTDNLPLKNIAHSLTKYDDLKAHTLVSFRKSFSELFKDFENKEVKQNVKKVRSKNSSNTL